MYKYNGVEYNSKDDTIKHIRQYAELECANESKCIQDLESQKRIIEERLESARSIYQNKFNQIVNTEELKLQLVSSILFQLDFLFLEY